MENNNPNQKIPFFVNALLKIKSFDWLATLLPFLVVTLQVLQENMPYWWHPIWSPTISYAYKIVYFTFSIFPEDTYYSCSGYVCLPSMVGITAFIVSLLVLFLISKFFIYFIKKYLISNSLIAVPLSIITIIFLLLSGGFYLTNYNQNKCEVGKERNTNYQDRHGIISFRLMDDSINVELFKEKNNKFGVMYLYKEPSGDIVVSVKNGEEIKKSCELETNPSIYAVWPQSLNLARYEPNWTDIRDSLCEEKGFENEKITECLKSLLKNEDDINIDRYSHTTVDNQGTYSDSYITFNTLQPAFEGWKESGYLTIGDKYDGNKFGHIYTIRKISGYEKMPTDPFNGPFIEIIIPNTSNDLSYEEEYEKYLIGTNIANELKLKLGKYEYTKREITNHHNIYTVYYTEVLGRKVQISLRGFQYFVKYPDLQKEFETVISTVEFNFND